MRGLPKALLFMIEIVLYAIALAIIFYIDWRYGIASTLFIIADSMKTFRMMRNEEEKKRKNQTIWDRRF